MADTRPGEGRSELDSVAKLVSLSETAPMPRIDGERPPLVTRPRPESDPSGLYPEPAIAPHTSGGGPATKPQSIVGELPVGLDAMFAAAGPEHETERTQTAPPVSNRRSTRYVVLAGAVVVVLAGLGTWALWPAPDSGGSAGQPAEVPVAPSKPSSAPPAVTTMTASPTPPAATDQVDHTTVRTTEGQKPPQRPASGHPSAPHAPAASGSQDVWSSVVSSYLQEWSSQHQQPPGHHRG